MTGLVVGVGAARGVAADEVLGVIADALAAAGLPPGAVTALATIDAKAAEPGIVTAAERLGVPLVTYPARTLAAIAVPSPSDAVRDATGTASVAEAAALASSPGGELLVPKRKSAPPGRPPMAVVAVAGPAGFRSSGPDRRPAGAPGDLGR